MREIRRDPDYLDDPVLLEYLQSIWQPLVEAARQRGDITPDIIAAFAFEAFLVRDRSVNAFALPGGYVGVHLGLINLTASADELASVLAHELTHVTQRHIARSVTTNQRQSLLALAGLILGVLAASKGNSPDAAQAAILGGQAAAVQGQLNFSRDMEREADRVGFSVLREAGFSPAGMARMFEKLDYANRLNDSGAYPYLRSHPLTTERIAEAQSRLGTGPCALTSTAAGSPADAGALARADGPHRAGAPPLAGSGQGAQQLGRRAAGGALRAACSRRCSCAISRAPPRRWPAASGWWLAVRSMHAGRACGPARGGVGGRARRRSRGRQAAGGAARRCLAAAHAAGGAGGFAGRRCGAAEAPVRRCCRAGPAATAATRWPGTNCRHAPSAWASRCVRCARRPSLAPRWATGTARSIACAPANAWRARAPRRTSSSRR